MTLRILIRGSNDIGSAVAHTLFQGGYAIVIHDVPKPTTTRRKMAFVDAIFDGSVILENVEARLVKHNFLVCEKLAEYQYIPVSTEKMETVLEAVCPQVLVDARMRKHQQPEPQRELAPLTIGLGPNFVAGVNVDLAVETSWGEQLGNVISQGSPRALEGEPKEINGHARDRYVYAPCAGVFRTRLQPGDPVKQGQEIAHIDQTPLYAPLTGLLRGITRDGVPVTVNTKIIEVDPRSDRPQISGISERPARIARGVLLAIRSWEATDNVD